MCMEYDDKATKRMKSLRNNFQGRARELERYDGDYPEGRKDAFEVAAQLVENEIEDLENDQ